MKQFPVWNVLGALVALALGCWHLMTLAAKTEPVRTELMNQVLIWMIGGAVLGGLVGHFALKKPALTGLLAGLLGSAGAAACLLRGVDSQPMAWCAMLGAAVAGVMHFALPAEDQNRTPGLLAAAAWVAVGAVAFSMARSTGMCLALITGALVAGSSGNNRVLGGLGILMALVSVRVLEITVAQAKLTLDLSHHHALLGLLLMVMAIDALTSQLTQSEGEARQWTLAGLGFALIAVLAVLIPVLTGPRAVPGVLLGCGVGIAVAGANLHAGARAWVAGGFGLGVLMWMLPQISQSLDLPRDQKMTWLYAGGALVAVLLVALMALAKRPTAEVAREA